MISRKNDFKKFISLQPCSREEFRNARYYLCNAVNGNRELFDKAINNIIVMCFEQFHNRNCKSLGEIKDVYENFGLNASDFRNYIQNNEILKNFVLKIAQNNIREIWKKAKDKKWLKTELTAIAQEYYITTDELNTILEDYSINILGHNYSKYRMMAIAFGKFSLKNLGMVNVVLMYYDIADREEKEDFHRRLKEIFQDIKANGNVNSWLVSHNMKAYSLHNLVSKFGDLDPELSNMVINSYKVYYDLVINLKNKEELLEIKGKKLGISVQNIRKFAKCYAMVVLKIENYTDILASFVANSGTKREALLKVMLASEIDEKLKIMEDAKIGISDIVTFVYSQNSTIDKEDKDKVEKSLLELLDMNKERNKLVEKNEAYTESLYQEFICSNLNIEEFCQERSLSLTTFMNKLTNVANKQLLEQVKSRIEQYKNAKTSLKKEYYTKEFLKLFNYISLGVATENGERNFDLLDYYIYFRHLNFNSFRRWYNKERRISIMMSKFFKPLENVHLVNKDMIRNSIHEVECQKDENGFPIPGTGRILSVEEMDMIIKFMDDNAIPFYDKLVSIAIRRYVAGTLEVSPLQTISR